MRCTGPMNEPAAPPTIPIRRRLFCCSIFYLPPLRCRAPCYFSLEVAVRRKVEGSRLNKAALGDGDVAPRGVLHQVHHLVGGADDRLGRAAVLRVAGYSEAGHDPELDSL